MRRVVLSFWISLDDHPQVKATFSLVGARLLAGPGLPYASPSCTFLIEST